MKSNTKNPKHFRIRVVYSRNSGVQLEGASQQLAVCFLVFDVNFMTMLTEVYTIECNKAVEPEGLSP